MVLTVLVPSWQFALFAQLLIIVYLGDLLLTLLGLQVTVELQSPCSTLLLRSTGSSLAFPGYLAAWDGIGSSSSSSADSAADSAAAAGEVSEVEDDDVAALAGPKGSALSKVLQQLQEGQLVALTKVRDCQVFVAFVVTMSSCHHASACVRTTCNYLPLCACAAGVASAALHQVATSLHRGKHGEGA
jgi:hypothetical protein